MLFTNLYESNFNENLRGAPEGAAFGAKYAEELAQKVFNDLPELDSSGSAEEVLDAAWDIAREELGDRKARSIFAYDEDFAGDLVTAYAWLQRGGNKEVAEAVTMDRSKHSGYPNDPATQKHRLDTAKIGRAHV